MKHRTRTFGFYEWEDGSSVRITVDGDVSAEWVIWAITRLLKEKRKEIANIGAGLGGVEVRAPVFKTEPCTNESPPPPT